ncbi:hypothetical protein [Maribellus mangrovi]|uniref:hypothetical protein n=1 Tax=Maribellus mangrovi TaxID=3133146 RepID=UPI0030EC5FE2
MKLIKFLMIGIFIMATSCTETFIEEPDPVLKSGVNNPLEFETVFSTILISQTDFYPWGDEGWWAFDLVYEGSGIAKHMGNTELLKYMKVTGLGMQFPFYTNANTAYISANKDTLWFITSSEVYPDPELGWPNKIFENFQSEFLYGTGRFAKATDGEVTRIATTADPDTGEGTMTERVIVYF